MLKIDIHTHILPPEIPKFKDQFGYGGFIEYKCQAGCAHVDMYHDNGNFFRRVEKNCFDPEQRLKEYAPHGTQVQVLSTVPVMFSYWAKPKDGHYMAQFLNDHVAKIVSQYPRNFIGLGTVPLQDPKLAAEEVARAKGLGLVGFQIGSHVNAWNLSDQALFPFYEACESSGMVLFVHPWEMMGQEKMPKYWLPWLVGMPAETSLAICSMIFGGIFERFPKLRVAFAHGGGAFPFTLGRIQHGFESRPDLVAVDCKVDPKKYLKHFYVDSLVHDGLALKYLLELFGSQQICLGTDYPFPLGEFPPGKLIQGLQLSQVDQENLFYRSALSWMGLKPERFGI